MVTLLLGLMVVMKKFKMLCLHNQTKCWQAISHMIGGGMGFFLENNYKPAFQWAKDNEKKGKIAKASVVGAVFSFKLLP